MPSTPKGLRLGYRQSSYDRVAFGKSLQEQERKFNSMDAEPLQDGKQMQQNGGPPSAGVDYINAGMEDQMEVQGYIRDKLRTTVCWIFVVISLGSLRLVFHWWPHWMLYATHRRCPLEIAEKVLVTERYQLKHKCYYVKNIKNITAESAREFYLQDEKPNVDHISLVDLEKLETMKLSVHTTGGVFKEHDDVRLFKCKKLRYIWDPDLREFYKLRGFDINISTSVLHQQKGLTLTEQFLRRAVFGNNEILVPMRSIMALLFLEVLNPFYIFQLFSFTLWIVDDYVYYALCILAISICSITVAVIQTHRNQVNLWSRVHSQDVASVVRSKGGDSEVVVIPTEQLVPGDLLVLPSHGCIMHCDAVLLAGNCIVNESMLTGESVPVTKTPVPNSADMSYNEREHARHTLFCGTQVIQTRYYGNERVYAVVVRTGFSTAKGSLVRSILYPPPVDFEFERDSYRFVRILAAIAAIGVVYTVVTKLLKGRPPSEVTLEALDLITIVVPPALPAAMTVGRMYAQARLEKANIFCISPRTINVSGSINCVCFDKTGTLTEDGLDMWGVVPVLNSSFKLPIRNLQSLQFGHLLKAMVTCHSLTIIDGSLTGDPLDLKMFESTGWVLEEPDVSDETKFDLISPTVVKPKCYNSFSDDLNELGLEIGIVRQFPFSSSLQRMSVITRRLGAREFTVYCKGSPEMVLALCSDVTVPADFDRTLEEYTREGYRVLGVGYKDLPARLSYAKMQRLTREEVEGGLTFLGLVVMENRLKPQTTGVLQMLRDANIRTIMVTGDNMLTALSVARDCEIIGQGQRVIMVHTVANDCASPPRVYFTQSVASRATETGHTITEMSQLTGTESVTSIQTLGSSHGGAYTANGITPNSVIIDLPFDNNFSLNEAVEKFDTSYSFALTGSTWTALREHHPDLLARVAARGAVFARMSPDHKQQLIQELQGLDYYVAMVGDGANDCGALKAAHAGISLSEAESSVASPFTSKEAHIGCIVRVIREGRSALVTSFSIFKYMAVYSLLQFASVVILYSIESNLTDIEFLYIDLFVITVFAFFLGRVEAYQGPLYPERPQSSLISVSPIVSLVGQIAIAVSAQLFAFYCVNHHKWVQLTDSEGVMEGIQNYSVFTVSSLQYIILALVFSKGPPYRRSLFTSPGLVVATLAVTIITLYIVIYPTQWLADKFELTPPPNIEFRLLMVGVGVVNLILAVVYEMFCDQVQHIASRCRQKVLSKHEIVEKEMLESPFWPEISSEAPPEKMHVPLPQRPKPTVTVINSPSPKKSSKIAGPMSVSDLQLEELKFATPMRSLQSLMGSRCVHQSEDSLSGYLTPPTSPGASSFKSPDTDLL